MQREMDKRKKQRLERAGWTAGSARDFLELSDKEAALLASVRITQRSAVYRGGSRTLITVPAVASPSRNASQRPFSDQLIVTTPWAGPSANRNPLS